VNVTRGSGAVAAGLAPLLAASQAEGFRFVARLAGELEAGHCEKSGEKHWEKSGAALFGACDEARLISGGLIGVVGLTHNPNVAGGDLAEVGRVRHLYVLPAYRLAGVGRALMAALIGEARLHYRVLRLRTDTRAAAAFYRTCGFSEYLEPHATHTLPL